jgi:mRNA-degrading endonuclease RelE of RelBE toxin-antitoxin system
MTSSTGAYRVTYHRSVAKSMKQLIPNARMRQKAWAALETLGDDPRPMGYVALTDRPGYRIWVLGKYRAIYEIDDSARVVNVLLFKHRRDVY